MDKNRERFEQSLAEYESNIGITLDHTERCIARKFWQAALSQPAVAGAVDEKMEQEMYIAWVISTGGSRDTGEYLWRNNGVSVQAWNHRATIRTASPSQPAAEDDQITSIIANAEQWEDDTGEKFVSFELSPDQRDAVLNTLRRASPADDGGKVWSTNDITDADMRSAEGGLGTKP